MTLDHKKSKELFATAKTLMPGGVNSPVRAFGSVGGEPLFIEEAGGAYLFDADGNKYIDYVGSWGPAIVGHAHPEVLEAIHQTMKKGLSFGAPTKGENLLAQRIRELMPSVERVRLVSSGTEACMSALRLARGFTGRDKIIKFTGCYHGHADMLLVQAGSGVLTLGLPDSPGVPKGATEHTLCARFNDLQSVQDIFTANKGQIAAVILEPITGNTGFIRPTEEFLNGLRKLTEDDGSLLIFDEVMTGFRVGLGGVQSLYGIKPDLTTLGKVIGGGMNIGAYGGRSDVMAKMAPEGPVYQAGTLSGNPVAVACGLKTLEILGRPGSFDHLSALSNRLMDGFQKAANDADVPLTTDCEGGMFGFYFHPGPVTCHEDAKSMDGEAFGKFFRGMIDEGIYLAPSAYEAGFVSLAHSEADIDQTIQAARRSLGVG